MQRLLLVSILCVTAIQIKSYRFEITLTFIRYPIDPTLTLHGYSSGDSFSQLYYPTIQPCTVVPIMLMPSLSNKLCRMYIFIIAKTRE